MHIDSVTGQHIEGIPSLVTRHLWLIPLLLLMLGMAIVIAGYLQYALWQGNSQSPSLRQWPGSKINPSQGQGQADLNGMKVTALQGKAMGMIPETNFVAEQYSDVAWQVTGDLQEAQMFMAWQRRGESDKWHYKLLNEKKSGTVGASMVAEPAWSGEIISIGFVIEGNLPAAVRINGVSLESGSAMAMLRGLVSGWVAFEPWSGSSINFIHGGMPNARFTFLTFAALSLGVGIALVMMLAAVRRLPSTLFVIGGLVVAAWLVTDARWQWNSWRQLGVTGRYFAGKTWEEKHLAAQDGELFRFIQQEVKTRLPPPPVRVLYFAGEPYLNGRGNYFLYPHNVFSYNYGGVGVVPAQHQFRSGDYVVLYQQGSLDYDLKKGVLSWSGGQCQAERIFVDGGNMLLRVI